MDKWQNLSDNERQDWIIFYKENDPTFRAVLDFCNNQDIYDMQSRLELVIIAILEQKNKAITENWIDDNDGA